MSLIVDDARRGGPARPGGLDWRWRRRRGRSGWLRWRRRRLGCRFRTLFDRRNHRRHLLREPAGRILRSDSAQQPDARRLGPRGAEPLVGIQRQLAAAPQRIVAVAAGRVAPDDRFVVSDDRAHRLEGGVGHRRIGERQCGPPAPWRSRRETASRRTAAGRRPPAAAPGDSTMIARPAALIAVARPLRRSRPCRRAPRAPCRRRRARPALPSPSCRRGGRRG